MSNVNHTLIEAIMKLIVTKEYLTLDILRQDSNLKLSKKFGNVSSTSH